MEDNDKIWWGVLNPKGEKDGTKTTYWTEHQLKELPKYLPGCQMLISHVDEQTTGKHISPGGTLLAAHVDPKSGKLIGAWTNNKTFMGQIFKAALGANGILHPDYRMNELSIGYNILTQKDKDGFDVPIANQPREVSICWAGAREGTHIKGCMTYGELKKKLAEKQYNKEPEEIKKINNTILENQRHLIKALNRFKMEDKTPSNTFPGIPDAGDEKPFDFEKRNSFNADDEARKFEQRFSGGKNTNIINTAASTNKAPGNAAASGPSSAEIEYHLQEILKRGGVGGGANNNEQRTILPDYTPPAKDVNIDLNKYNFLGVDEPTEDDQLPDLTDVPEAKKQDIIKMFKRNKELEKTIRYEDAQTQATKRQKIQEDGLPFIQRLVADAESQGENIRGLVPAYEEIFGSIPNMQPKMQEAMMKMLSVVASKSKKEGETVEQRRKDASTIESEFQAALKAKEEAIAQLKKVEDENNAIKQKLGLFPDRAAQVQQNYGNPSTFPGIPAAPQTAPFTYRPPNSNPNQQQQQLQQGQSVIETAAAFGNNADVFTRAHLIAGRGKISPETALSFGVQNAKDTKMGFMSDPFKMKVNQAYPKNYKAYNYERSLQGFR